jgi:hypothetical protein
MPPAGDETAIPASESSQTIALDRLAIYDDTIINRIIFHLLF